MHQAQSSQSPTSSPKNFSVTLRNPTLAPHLPQGLPFPVANSANIAPSKTNQPGGAKARYEEGKDVSQTTSSESEAVPADLKPRAYSSGEARMWNSIEMRVESVVVVVLVWVGRGSSSYCDIC
jgi:hypothetical protein